MQVLPNTNRTEFNRVPTGGEAEGKKNKRGRVSGSSNKATAKKIKAARELIREHGLSLAQALKEVGLSRNIWRKNTKKVHRKKKVAKVKAPTSRKASTPATMVDAKKLIQAEIDSLLTKVKALRAAMELL